MNKAELRRYGTLVASLLILTCLGSLYAWSAFVPELKKGYGLTTSQSQLIFGGLIAVFTVSMVFTGRKLEGLGPKPFLLGCSILLAFGYGIASFSHGNFALLLFGIAGLVGTATGMGYVTSLTACMKWFPERKGSITGIAMGAFGLGAILVANAVQLAFGKGVNVLTVFLIQGTVFFAVGFLSTLLVTFPTTERSIRQEETPLAIQRPFWEPFFWAMVIAMLCGTFGGLIIIGNLTELIVEKGFSVRVATVAVSLFSVGNALGRVFWGRVVDRVGEKVVLISLVFLAFWIHGLVYSVGTTLSAAAFEVSVVFLIGFGFGASFVIHAALTASRFGIARVGEIYPLVFLAYGVAGICGPPVSGVLRDNTASYSTSILTAMIVVLLGAAFSVFVMRRRPKEPSSQQG